MSSFSNTTKNNQTLTNLGSNADILVDEATMLVNDADRPVDSLGLPLTKADKNNKTLSNNSEGI